MKQKHRLNLILSGSVASPNFPKQYESNLQCEWAITAPSGSRIRIDFNSFELEDNPECKFDKFEIIDSQMERTFCGRKSPGPLFSSGSSMTLRFKSDEMNEFKGFNAIYSFINNTLLDNICAHDKATDLDCYILF